MDKTPLYTEQGEIIGEVSNNDEIRETVRRFYGPGNDVMTFYYHDTDDGWCSWTSGPGGADGLVKDADVPPALRDIES